jgi:hypothetical protein
MATPFGLISLACLLHSLDHIFNDLLRITKNHHGFIQIEELITEASKNRDLEQYKKEQEKLNLLG